MTVNLSLKNAGLLNYLYFLDQKAMYTPYFNFIYNKNQRNNNISHAYIFCAKIRKVSRYMQIIRKKYNRTL